MSCGFKKKKKKKKKSPCLVIVNCDRRRRRRRRGGVAFAEVNNIARVGNQTGLIPINLQIPINLGDAQAQNRSKGASQFAIV